MNMEEYTACRQSAGELAQNFPGAEWAVAFMELVFVDSPASLAASIEMARTGKMNMDKLVLTWKNSMISTLARKDRPQGSSLLEQALAQVDHPQFRVYLAGKMGMV